MQPYTIGFFICCIISLMVFVTLIYSAIKFRNGKGVGAVHFHKKLVSEIIWTTIPFLILVALALPAAMKLMEDNKLQTVSVRGLG